MSDKALWIYKETIVVDELNAVYPKEFNEDYVHSLKAGGVWVGWWVSWCARTHQR